MSIKIQWLGLVIYFSVVFHSTPCCISAAMQQASIIYALKIFLSIFYEMLTED